MSTGSLLTSVERGSANAFQSSSSQSHVQAITLHVDLTSILLNEIEKGFSKQIHRKSNSGDKVSLDKEFSAFNKLDLDQHALMRVLNLKAGCV